MVLEKYLSILGSGVYSPNGESADVEPLYAKGVPIFNNVVKDSASHDFYFKYHHTAADSMSMMSADDLDSNVVGIAAFLYIIADLDQTVRNITS